MAKSKKKKHNSFFGARLTSTISTSLVLFLLGIIALLGVMATQLTVYVRGNMGFSVVLDENVTDAQIKTLQKRLTAAPYARKVQYISKSDALKELYMELGENPEDLLGYNPLRPSLCRCDQIGGYRQDTAQRLSVYRKCFLSERPYRVGQ